MYRSSVLISYYNSSKFIARKIENIKSQSVFDECEFIFINGGSQERDEDYVIEAAQSHQNIVNIGATERISLYSAWNIGIQASNAPLLCNSNVDDIIAPNALSELCDALESNPDCSIAYPDIVSTSKINSKWGEGIEFVTTNRDAMGPLLMWRKSLHDRYGMFDERFWVLGDADFFYDRLACEKTVKVPKPLVMYWIGDSNLYRNLRLRQRDEALLESKRLGMCVSSDCFL